MDVKVPGSPCLPWPHGIIGVVASAGGVEALKALTTALPADFPAAVLVTLHLPRRAIFESRLAEVLAERSGLPVVWAQHGEHPLPGAVYIAPQDSTMVLTADHSLCVAPAPPQQRMCPNGNAMLTSIALRYGHAGVAVVLTGALDDGARGSDAVSRAGGVVLVQDPATAQFCSMPAATVAIGAAHHVMPLPRLIHALVALFTAPGARAWLDVKTKSPYWASLRCESRAAGNAGLELHRGG